MDAKNASVENANIDRTQVSESVPNQVFQPPQLKDIIDVIDLMGTVSSRVREDNIQDLPTTKKSSASTTTAISAREEAIAKLPEPLVMQQKLIAELESEIAQVEKQARALAKSKKKGSAYLLTELYRKIRRLSSMISSIMDASTDLMKRFYISVFIDRQALPATNGVGTELEKK